MGFAQSRQLVGRVLLIGIAGTLVIGCSAIGIGGNAPTAGQNPGARPGTTVSVVKVVEGPITQAVAYSGSVQSGDSVSLVPKTAGRITKLGVDVGSTVKAGDVVAELDHSSLDALVVQAQAGVDAAQVKLDQMQAGARPETVAIAEANARAAKARADAVAGGGRDEAVAQAQADAAAQQAKLAASLFTDLDLKAARVTVEQAQAALAIARSGLADSQIVAPFDGVISTKFLSLGALASPATPIVTVMSPRLQVQFSVEEGRIGNIKADQSAVLTTSAFPDRTFPAKVASIYPAADPKTHTFTVVVEPENPDGSLRAGMFVELKVILASRDKATLASRAAVVQKGAQQVVFAVANGKAQMRAVIGMVMLLGLVAKNAILLIDYSNTLRHQGRSRREALIEAGPIRLRPIVMTTCTIMFAMLPLVLKFEAGAESRAPMAAVVMGGVLSSMLLTLVFVPVMYTYLDDAGESLSSRFGRGRPGGRDSIIATPVPAIAGGAPTRAEEA